MRIIDLVLTIIFGGICLSFFGFNNPLDSVDIITLLFLSVFWLIPHIFKPRKCVACRMIESEPQSKNFSDTESYIKARKFWRKKNSFIDRMSQDAMQDIAKDLFILHTGATIKLVTIMEEYALGFAEMLEEETEKYHQVSTLELYLQEFEEEIRDA